jgi:hypothetical protein
VRKHVPTVVLILAAAFLAGAVAYTTLRLGRGEDEPPELPDPPKFGVLEARLPQARADAERAVSDYNPARPDPITYPARPVLRRGRGPRPRAAAVQPVSCGETCLPCMLARERRATV